MTTEKRKRGRPAGSFIGAVKFVNGKRTRTFSKWLSMHARCNDRGKRSKYYFKRGIVVCDRWCGRLGYANFLSDMGEAPAGLTLERRENDHGYSPANCYWATWKEQANNRRRVGPVPDPDSLRQKCLAAGLPYTQVYLRIKRGGWPEQEALSTPIQPRGRPVRREGVLYGRQRDKSRC